MFLALDGLDGTGKTTQLDQLERWLKAGPLEVVRCQDPGSTALGMQIRQILLHVSETPIGRRSEMFLYMAARAQMVEFVIKPALAAGSLVLSDRFLLANVVYQGYAGGLEPETIWEIGKEACQGIQPDLTFILDMSPEAAQARLQRTLDRMEQVDSAFRERLRFGYLKEAEAAPDRFHLIDSNRDPEAIQNELRTVLLERFPESCPATIAMP
ncbi:Thymidylate kinase [Planctomycetales bacterium 10988]|nr:Thymidylate kinase [Planctomycetales bacterium 10988]